MASIIADRYNYHDTRNCRIVRVKKHEECGFIRSICTACIFFISFAVLSLHRLMRHRVPDWALDSFDNAPVV